MNNKIEIHYALQVCDTKNFQVDQRFCTNDRTELSKKSIVSFLQAVKCLVKINTKTINYIRIFEDNCSQNLKEYINQLILEYCTDNIQIDMVSLNDGGISNSIRHCYEWLAENGKNLVYQVQDDYLFTEKSLFYMVDMFYQLYQKYNTHAIISPYNNPVYVKAYEGRATPRAIELGQHSYWFQVYDISCSFLTSHQQFLQHRDIYDMFYELVERRLVDKTSSDLEDKSLNYIFTQRGVLGITPVTGLTFHMQGPAEQDPYIDWRPLWDSIKI